MYTALVFLEKLKSGEFTFDTKGHKFYGDVKGVIETIIENIEWHIQYYKDIQDPTCKYHKEEKTQEQVEASMAYGKRQSKFYEDDTRFTEVGRPIYDISRDFNCGVCGNTYGISLIDENTLGFHRYTRNEDNKTIHILDDCVFKDGIKPHKTRITVPSGKLHFANHFYKLFEDAPEDEKYSTPYSLNYRLGRRNIADYLANQNIGYQQVGNTSVQFYMRKDGSEIIVDNYSMDNYHDYLNGYNEYELTPETIEKYKQLDEEFECVGSISMGVWRWMCGDAQLVENKGFEPDQYMDHFIVDVEPNSTWEITDIYNSDECEDRDSFSICATIKKVV